VRDLPGDLQARGGELVRQSGTPAPSGQRTSASP
jgi:hypothetical protein